MIWGLLSVLCGAAAAGVLGFAGITFKSWEFYAILFLMVAYGFCVSKQQIEE